MSTKGLFLLLGVTVVIVGWASQNQGRVTNLSTGGVAMATGDVNASIGTNALGAATGTLNSSGNPRGGLGS